MSEYRSSTAFPEPDHEQTGFPDAATRDDFAGAWPDVLALLRDRAEAG